MSFFKKIIEELKPDLNLTGLPTMPTIGTLDEFPIKQWEQEEEDEKKNKVNNHYAKDVVACRKL